MPNPLFDALLAPRVDSARPFAQRPDGPDLDYAGFLDLVARAAVVLTDAGLRPGDRVVVKVPKSIEALAVYGACIARGLVFVPLNTAYTPREVTYFIEDAEPGLILCTPEAEAETRAGGVPVMTLDARGGGRFAEAMGRAAPVLHAVDRAPEDLAALLYTSGTTGRSKGAMLSHGNLLANAQALVDAWRITGDDRLIHALPIFHAHGLFVAINTTLLSGASMIFLPGFDADAILDAMPDATTMMGVPTFYTRLLEQERLTPDHAATMRLFVSGSAPLLAETHRRFETRTGHRILERYGMTETGMNASNPYDGERRAGTVGPALPGVDLRVMEDGSEVPTGEIGTLQVRGPNVFSGYWRMPEKTAEELGPDGWFITGDLASIDADGYVTIVGRGKDLVITGGYNVYPKEVEDVLDAVDGVDETAVIGVPHPDFGEAVVAVVAAPGGTCDEDALRARAKAELADYKRPKHYAMVETLPRNTMGKVQKAELRARLNGLFA